jgi:hypothetical protein
LFLVGFVSWRFAAAAAYVLRTRLTGSLPQEAQELITVTYFQPLFFLRTSNQLILFVFFLIMQKPKVLLECAKNKR